MKLIPKNWASFQHYKHRSPPWIKLHRNLLDDMQFQRLPIASKAIAPMLWLLASESNDGVISKTNEEIAFRLRMSEKDVLNAIKPLIEMGFFIEDSTMLANCLQDATTEREKSRERVEKEKEKESHKGRVSCPENVSSIIWDDYIAIRKAKKSPLTATALKGLQREAEKANKSLEEALEICCERGWVGFNAEWLKNMPQIRKELPLGSDKQIEEAYRIECNADPAKARFNSYYEMRNFILKQRENRKVQNG